MTTIYHDEDGDLALIRGEAIAVVGYGNQGRSWALNLRDSGADVRVCVRADESRDAARADGFETGDLRDASELAMACVLVPDDAIPSLPIERPADGLTVIASGYSVGFDRWSPAGDVGMVAPRMLGPEVRRCFEEGSGFITAIGVYADVSGRALSRTLAVAKGIGGLREGALALTPKQEAVLDLAVEQVLSPALAHVNQSFVATMLAAGIPIEAVLTELFMSGEVERNYRLLREVGFTGQLGFHSPASQYGQLSRRGAYDTLDVGAIMQRLTDDIESGRFADEWDAEARAGFEKLESLKEQFAGPAIKGFETAMRGRLGPGARKGD